MKKTLWIGYGLLSALCLGGALPARAQTSEPDFSQLERVSERNKPCKRLEKKFQPVFEQIEKERREEGIEAPSQVLWFADNRNLGYCMAVSYPLVGDNAMLLKHFPKESLVGGRYVRWDPEKKEIESDTVVERMMVRNFIKEEVENPDITALSTEYYDRKNKRSHWIWYRLRETSIDQYLLPNDDEYFFVFSSESVKSILFLELHYRTLLDDLAETAEAGPRRNLLILQIRHLQSYLRERFNDTAFLEAEHKRRGPLMRIVDSAWGLEGSGWTAPDVCTEGERWWPCRKAKEE